MHLRRPFVSALPLLALVLTCPAPEAVAQNAPAGSTAPAAANRVLGNITALGSGEITVHTEGASATDMTIAIADTTKLLRTAPGQTTLKDATPLQLSDLAVGDRVLILLSHASTPEHPSAAALIAMKQTDIQQANSAQTEDWNRRGVAGIVETTDPSTGNISIKSGESSSGTLLLHTTATTIFRRYSPSSTSFANTHKAGLADIHAGDQIRARGNKNALGTEVNVEEVVAGSFRNIAGTVQSTDVASSTLTITNLATKKTEMLHIAPDTQMRQLPDALAQRLARRATNNGTQSADTQPTPGAQPVQGGGTDHPHSRGDLASMLQRAPGTTLAALKKGDAVMIVASGPDASTPSAITVVSGVEPLLRGSSQASQDLLSASWNLNGGGGEGGESGSPQR